MIATMLFALQTPRYSLPTPPPCGVPFHDVVILQRITPDVPANVAIDHPTQGTAQVSVGPDGSVLGVKVVQSTGDALLDAAIVEAAKRSTYKPKEDNCSPIAGSYAFHASFAVPSPAPSSGPVDPCNHEGRVSTSAHAVLPSSVHVAQTTTALVRVTIDANGQLTGEKLAESTGSAVLDQSALDAAKHSVYAPKYVACKPVAAEYVFRIVFDPH